MCVWFMSAAIPRVRAVAVLPLDFVGRLRILRTMHLPGALHGAESSLLIVLLFWVPICIMLLSINRLRLVV